MDGMEGQVDTFKEDVEEHNFLDTILADIVVEPMKVTDDADLETAAHTDLEECMEECGGKTDVDVKDDTMRTYLNNTNLDIKNIVSSKRYIVSPKRYIVSSKRYIVSAKRCIVSPKRYIVSAKKYICDGRNTTW